LTSARGGDFAARFAVAGPKLPAPAAPASDRVELSSGIPSTPPDEVLDAIGAAAQAYEDLRARGRELRFSTNDRSGQLVIEVRDLDGRVLSRIPPTEALAVASGSFR
jgi:flagellar protein FlaG